MHTRAWKRHRQFKGIEPRQLQVGDTIACYSHDDQNECRAARVCHVWLDTTPGVWKIPVPKEKRTLDFAYDYKVFLVLRHINTGDLTARGGESFTATFYPWNSVYRYTPADALTLRR